MVSVALTRALPRLATATARTVTPRLIITKGVTNAVPGFARTLAAAATKKTTAPKKKDPAKKTAATTKKAAATKKTAAAAKKTVAKKAAPKKKAVVVKKPVKKVKKVLTEEQKAEKAFAAKVKIAKETALPRQPPSGKLSPFNVYIASQMKSTGGNVKLATVAQTYKGLTIQELQGLAREAEKQNAERVAENKKWIEQYTPVEIEKANYARRWLKKHNIKRVDTTVIKDHRKILGRRSAYIYYCLAQKDSGEFGDAKITEKAAINARKWNAMSAAEKQPYEELSLADKERYERERADMGFEVNTKEQ
ncbi:hypothetical protein EX30DRAFT_342063 [Ascodesmis nigricans]|uniref:HMG box domain-containing protein n=1 Tax=Ascodesmis nigricans TaxID=341454 RepID=A0A4S2MTA8_9PEZI|nr:hypothetical protein EX30DRAFT_342063 [Ascodesmis nigricans]